MTPAAAKEIVEPKSMKVKEPAANPPRPPAAGGSVKGKVIAVYFVPLTVESAAANFS